MSHFQPFHFNKWIPLTAAVVAVLAGCGSRESSADVSSSQEAAAGSARIQVEILPDQTSELPYFTTAEDDPTPAMDELNEEVEEIRRDYDNAQRREDETVTVTTTTDSGSRILQTTMAATDDWITMTGRERTEQNLKSLAYDKETDTAITCVEALKMADISGVTLSQNVEEALLRLDSDTDAYAGNLRSTEMQGFLLDEDGKLVDIYMKLEIDTGKEDLSQFFFVYDPRNAALTPYVWPE